MKAIIMAGGEGTRLRPLTCDCPKPMMRLMDRPIIEYSLELLSLHGIKEAAVTLGYLPERIRDHLGEESQGVKLRYYTERRPLGTAGGVKQARDFLDGAFCVLSGDGVTDCDLTAALEFHKKRGAKATMVLKRLADPTSYGLVMNAPDGRVTSFVEKPVWGEVVSDTVNTGIYILEPEILDMIPEGPYDFGRELFPRLAAENLLYGYVTDGYWCDIGDISAYLGMCRDALDGRIALPGLSMPKGGMRISESADVHASARLEAPCYIGPGARIGKDAHIGAYSMIENSVRIGEHASVKRSVIWPGARLDEAAQARGCALGRGVHLAACARVYENCALGAGASIGIDSEVAPGVCIWPSKHIGEATLTDSNIVWGGVSAACFHGGELPIASPADALQAAQACAAALNPREVLIGRSPSAIASAMWHSCAAGLMAQGAQVLDAGICTLPQLRYTMELMQTDCGLMVTGNGVMPLTMGGTRLPRGKQRSICALLSRQDYPRPFAADVRPVAYSGRSDQAYVAMLASAFCADPALAMPVAVHCEDQLLLNLAEQAFNRAGLRARFEWEDELMELFPGEMGIWLSPDGSGARFSHAAGMLTDPQTELLACWTALERGERGLIVPERATRAISEIAGRANASVHSVPGDRAVYEQALKVSAAQLRLNTDGIYFAICALSALTENALTLSGWLSTMPRVHRMEKRFHLDDAMRGSTLRRLTESDVATPYGSGLGISRENAYAWISPNDDRPECTVVAESRDMEAARELCDFCISELQRLSGEKTNA